jgi:hypothetical protein
VIWLHRHPNSPKPLARHQGFPYGLEQERRGVCRRLPVTESLDESVRPPFEQSLKEK